MGEGSVEVQSCSVDRGRGPKSLSKSRERVEYSAGTTEKRVTCSLAVCYNNHECMRAHYLWCRPAHEPVYTAKDATMTTKEQQLRFPFQTMKSAKKSEVSTEVWKSEVSTEAQSLRTENCP